MAEMGQHNKDDVEEYYMINNAQKYLDMFEDLIQRSLPKAENGSSEPDAYLVKQNKHRSENL
jgi:hypothetical protein